ncbi:MAG: bile acid:sodium symporter [Spirochaetales bacterium]|nr:bile acid:sodium symporter [Spirochaetales bacterium]
MKWYSFIQKYFGAFFAAGILLGLFLPRVFLPISDYVLLILGSVMTLTFLTIDYKAILNNLKKAHVIGITILILKVILPFIFYTIAKPLGETVSIGILLLTLTPIATVAPTLTKLMKGDTEFIIILQTLTTLLSPIYMPALLLFFAGTKIEIDTMQMVKTLIFLILIPFCLSLLIRPLFKVTIQKTQKYFGAVTLLLITILLTGLLAGASAPIMKNPIKAFPLALIAFGLGIILPLTGWFVFFFFDKKKRIGLSISTLYMNIGLTAVIAYGFFDADVILFILLYELPANLIPSVLEKIYPRLSKKEVSH